VLIGHLADIHLGAKLYGRSELREDTLKAFEEAINTIINERVNVVVIAGDLFDKPHPENEFLLGAIRLLKKVTEKGIKVILVGGDHDTPKIRDKSPLEILSETIEGVYYPLLKENSTLEDLIINVNKTAFATIPFPKGTKEAKRKFYETIIPALASLVRRGSFKKAVLVGHFGVDEICKWDPMYPAAKFPKEFNYIALGHIHIRYIGKECDRCPIYAYPGSLYPLKLDEIENTKIRGPLIVDLSGDEPVIHEPNIEIRRHYVVKVRFSNEVYVKERLKAKLKSYADKKGSVIHLELEVPPKTSLITSLRNMLSDLEKDLSLIIVYRIKTLKETSLQNLSSSKDVDELEVISRFVGGNRELSKLILELKNAIVNNESTDVIKRIVNELTNDEKRSLWISILRRRSII
jgi:exonuclease SbcD